MTASDSEEDADVFRTLLDRVQKLVRAFTRRSTPATPETPPKPTTEVAELDAQVSIADKALASDVAELARRAVEEASTRRAELVKQRSELVEKRQDVDHRREELAALIGGHDWKVVHRERKDFLGPFTVEHTSEAAALRLGDVLLCKLSFPSGREILDAVNAERVRLEAEAKAEWPALRDRAVAAQAAGAEAVAWADLVAAIEPDAKAFKKRLPGLLYALTLLRSRQLEGDWTVAFKPPTLAKQNKREALTVPRIDSPGNPDRIAALRIERSASGGGE